MKKYFKIAALILFVFQFGVAQEDSKEKISVDSQIASKVLANYVTYTPLNQEVTTNSNQEVIASVLINCYGDQPDPIFISVNICESDEGYLIHYFEGGAGTGILYPGQSVYVKFKFKKTVSANNSFTYGFSTANNSCTSTSNKISIKVNYNAVVTPPSCNLPATVTTISNIQSNSANCSWTPVFGAISYRVSYRRSNVVNESYNFTTTNTSFSLNDLVYGQEYTIRVTAVCTGGVTSSNFSISNFTTLCPTFSAPTSVTATPSGYGYLINFSPIPNYQGYYILDYINLSNNSTGSQTTHNGDYFYYVSAPNSFNFRIRPQGGNCSAPSSDWINVVPVFCPSGNFPSNLMVISQSSGMPGSVSGGIFMWNPVTDSTGYEVEYVIYNLLGQSITNNFLSSNSTQSYPAYASNSQVSPTKYIKFRVKSKCPNGTWSDYSPWSNAFNW